jgi:two-component system cell cycle sensor histidine kinase/response regulator CckA
MVAVGPYLSPKGGHSTVQGACRDRAGVAGEGTTLTLYLPATREKAAEETPKLPVEKYMGHGELVLVVDDVEDQRQVATLLTQLNYQVNRCYKVGEDAI